MINDEFVRRLRESEETRLLIAKHLAGRGHDVFVPALRVRPTAAEWRDYVDNGDLEIRQRIEAKRANKVFTCAEDWPYESILVYGKEAWDRANPRIAGVYIVSQCGKYAAKLLASTSSRWWVESKADRAYGRELDFMMAPLDCAEWVQL